MNKNFACLLLSSLLLSGCEFSNIASTSKGRRGTTANKDTTGVSISSSSSDKMSTSESTTNEETSITTISISEVTSTSGSIDDGYSLKKVVNDFTSNVVAAGKEDYTPIYDEDINEYWIWSYLGESTDDSEDNLKATIEEFTQYLPSYMIKGTSRYEADEVDNEGYQYFINYESIDHLTYVYGFSYIEVGYLCVELTFMVNE